MNYDDYYVRQVGGALPYFTGARVQRFGGARVRKFVQWLPLCSNEVLSLWGSVRWRLERRLLAMLWLVRTSRR